MRVQARALFWAEVGAIREAAVGAENTAMNRVTVAAG